MNAMKLLVHRDVLHILYTHRFGLFVMVFLLWIVPSGPHALPYLFILCAYFFSIGLYHNQESEAVRGVYGALPVSKGQLAAGRYLTGYLLILLLCAYFTAACPLANRIDGERRIWLPFLIIGICAYLLLMSLYLPLPFLIGQERSHEAVLVLFSLIVAFPLLKGMAFPGTPRPSALLAAQMTVVRGTAAIVVCALISCLSMLVSVKAGKKARPHSSIFWR